MLAIDIRRDIRRRHQRGETITAICRRLNISRKTVQNVIHSKDIFKPYVRTVQPYPALEKYIDQLDRILQDRLKNHLQLSPQVILKELQISGYLGSYTSVWNYISKWKKHADNKDIL